MGGDRGHKRKAEGGGGKSNKRQYFSGSNKDKTIPSGTRGVMVSAVAGKERQAAHEAIALLTEAYEALCPEKAAAKAAAAAEAASAPSADPAALLAGEVAELKDKDKQLFRSHNSGLNSVVYVEYRDDEGPTPTQLVSRICQEAKDTKQNRSRFCCRFHPVEHQCYSSMDKIHELAEKVVAKHFPTGEGVEPITFAVQYEHRAAPPLDRMEVINAFAERIKAPHKVHLNQPQQTILVNVVKSQCAVAVIPQFRELGKLNLRTLTGEDDEQQQKGKQGGGKKQQAQEKEQQQKEQPTVEAEGQEKADTAAGEGGAEEQQAAPAEAS